MRKGSTRLFSERLQTFYKPMLSLLFFQCFCCLSSDPSRAGAIRTRTLERWPVLSNTATQWLPLSVMGHRGSSTPLLKMTAPRCKSAMATMAKEFSPKKGSLPPKESWSISYPSGHPEDPNPASPSAHMSILPCKGVPPFSWWDCMWHLCPRPTIKHRAKKPQGLVPSSKLN